MAASLGASFANIVPSLRTSCQVFLRQFAYYRPEVPKRVVLPHYHHKKVKQLRTTKPRHPVEPPKLFVGQYGIYSEAYSKISSEKLERCRNIIAKRIGRQKDGSKFYLEVCPHIPDPKKTLIVKVGKTKVRKQEDANVYELYVKPGHMLFEFNSIARAAAERAFRVASSSLRSTHPKMRVEFVAEETAEE